MFERLLQNNKNLKYKHLIYSLKENKSYKRINLNDDLSSDIIDLDFDDIYEKKEKKYLNIQKIKFNLYYLIIIIF